MKKIKGLTVAVVVTILFLSTFCSCASFKNTFAPSFYIPEIEKLREIEMMPCQGCNCCIDKALMHSDWLKGKGIEATFASGRRYLEKGKLSKDSHMWLEVKNPKTGNRHMIDPAFFGRKYDGEGYEINKKYETDSECIDYYSGRIKKYAFSRDATKEDLLKRRYEKMYWKAVEEEMKIYKQDIAKGDIAKGKNK